MITAHHEAGHAVAAVLERHGVSKISIEADDHSMGRTLTAVSFEEDVHNPFVTYGGVWAEARLRCHSRNPEFAKHVKDVFASQSCGDGPRYRAELRKSGRKHHRSWDEWLEVHWGAIQRVAALLLAGVVGVESELDQLVKTR